jgi:hypothetical protein
MRIAGSLCARVIALVAIVGKVISSADNGLDREDNSDRTTCDVVDQQPDRCSVSGGFEVD